MQNVKAKQQLVAGSAATAGPATYTLKEGYVVVPASSVPVDVKSSGIDCKGVVAALAAKTAAVDNVVQSTDPSTATGDPNAGTDGATKDSKQSHGQRLAKFRVGKPARAKAGRKGGRAGAYGAKPDEFILPVSFSVGVVSGLVNGVLPVDVTTSPEWANLRAMYDEYKFVGARMEFVSNVAGNPTTPNGMLGVCWDPDDQGALTATREAAEHKFYKLFGTSQVVPAPSGSATSGTNFLNEMRPLTFAFHTSGAETLTIGSGGAVSFAPGMWKDMPAASLNGSPDGVLKFYLETNGTLTGNGAVVGFCFYRVLCRMRT